MLKKVLGVFLLAVLAISFCSMEAMAKSSGKLTYFHTEQVTEKGQDIYRIEIGMNKADAEYNVVNRKYLYQRIEIDLPNIKRGGLKKKIELNNEFVSGIDIKEDDDNTKVTLNVSEAGVEAEYDIYTAPADRKSNKPYRIVIDVKRAETGNYDPIEGLAGHNIVIDPGHGGSDTGAIGDSGLLEKDVCLSVSKKVEGILKSSGANVVMTRDDDRDVYGLGATDRQELQARVDVGLRNRNTEVFVSIHCNAFSSPSAHGMETYYYYKSDADYKLAQKLNEELESAGGLFNRGVKSANFYVMRHSVVPASLVELAFITNYNEERLLADESYQERLAYAIARGIGRYFTE